MHALVCALLVRALLGVHHGGRNDILADSDDTPILHPKNFARKNSTLEPLGQRPGKRFSVPEAW